jgi:hypothetical protein
VVAGDVLAGAFESRDLVGQPPWCRIVVVVPVRDDVARCALAPKVALVANSYRPLKMNEPDDPVVRRNQIANVRAVRYD